MKISKYLHSCIVLEKDGVRLLFDPGTYSFVDGSVKPEEFGDIAAIFITHNHPDHYDPEALKVIVQNNPGVKLFANPMTAETLNSSGFFVETFHDGEIEIGACTVRAIPAAHEQTLLYPVPENTAYLVDGAFLHPGDSLNSSMHGLKPKVLAFPIYAPWMTQHAAMEFAHAVRPEIGLAIHDWPLKDPVRKGQTPRFQKVFADAGMEFRTLELGETLEV